MTGFLKGTIAIMMFAFLVAAVFPEGNNEILVKGIAIILAGAVINEQK